MTVTTAPQPVKAAPAKVVLLTVATIAAVEAPPVAVPPRAALVIETTATLAVAEQGLPLANRRATDPIAVQRVQRPHPGHLLTVPPGRREIVPADHRALSTVPPRTGRLHLAPSRRGLPPPGLLLTGPGPRVQAPAAHPSTVPPLTGPVPTARVQKAEARVVQHSARAPRVVQVAALTVLRDHVPRASTGQPHPAVHAPRVVHPFGPGQKGQAPAAHRMIVHLLTGPAFPGHVLKVLVRTVPRSVPVQTAEARAVHPSARVLKVVQAAVLNVVGIAGRKRAMEASPPASRGRTGPAAVLAVALLLVLHPARKVPGPHSPAARAGLPPLATVPNLLLVRVPAVPAAASPADS